MTTDEISYSGLGIALFFPWLLGVVWTRWLSLRSGRWNWFILLGLGYFLGIFVTTLLIRLSDALTLGLSFPGLATTLVVLIVGGIALQIRQSSATPQLSPQPDISRWETILVITLLALIAWRYLTILQEMLLRPLYAWDAWMNWAPKAITWFHLGELVEYVKPDKWLAQAADSHQYTLGNRGASEYPPTVPLILLWSMLGAGHWDHSAILLPWFLAAINLGLALFGYLRLNGCTVLPSTVACYLLLNMPYYNVHTVLAGYADLWLAAAFGLSVFALVEWQQRRSWAHGLACALMALLCSQLKVPGIILAAIMFAAMLRSWINLGPRSELALLASVAIMIALLFSTAPAIHIPYLGPLVISASLIEIPGIGDFNLSFHPVWPFFARSMFIMINWNIGWYLLPLVAILLAIRGARFQQPEADTFALVGACAMVLLAFFFTEHHGAAESFTTLNRALLYLVPTLVFSLSIRVSGVQSQPDSAAASTK